MHTTGHINDWPSIFLIFTFLKGIHS
uniref:Uncharacterized protein n=1 Tax=Arundo donax TaxID=35708 RepID=A0A0A9A283_ARUDO